MKNASSYLPGILSLGLAASMLWAILSMPPGLGQQSRLQTLLHSEAHHHPGAYVASWDEVFAPWRR
jgi:hypothetical protein